VSGAKNIPLESLAAAGIELSKDTDWVVYDRQAERAKTAAQTLAAKGFNVKELSGGIQVWSAKKYPMESGEGK
jgi:rhodanese-related sulfurtransferase